MVWQHASGTRCWLAGMLSKSSGWSAPKSQTLKEKSPPTPSQLERRRGPNPVPIIHARPRRCWKNGFWLVTLLYPRCAMTALQLFSWAGVNGVIYLRIDYRVVVRLRALAVG